MKRVVLSVCVPIASLLVFSASVLANNFLGRKVEAADSNTSAVDASLSVVCLDTP